MTEVSASTRRRRIGFVASVFTLVLLSGFHNLWSASWSPYFRLNLLLHPALGVVAMLTIIATLFESVRKQVPQLGLRHLITFVVMCFVAMARGFTLKHGPESVSNLLTLVLTPVLVGSTVFFITRTVPLLPAIARARRGWAHLALVCLWLLALLLGVMLLATAAAGRVASWIVSFHAAVGYAATAVGIWVLVAPARGRLRESGVLAGVSAGGATLLLLALAVNGIGHLLRPDPEVTPVELHLSVIPPADRQPGDRDPSPLPMDASWIEIGDSCGASACHEGLLEEHRRSVHATAYHTPHMQKVLTLLADELGEPAQAMCAGCHVPGSLFEGGPPTSAYQTRANMSCVLCHSVVAAEIDDALRSRYTVAPPVRHLAPFRDAEARGTALARFERTLIQLNTRAHGRALGTAALSDDALCLACHHTQLRSVAGTEPTSERQRCIDCHMASRTAFGHDDAARSHLFVGSNTTIPTLRSDAATADETERWMRGEFLVATFEDLYAKDGEERILGDERLAGYEYGEMAASFAAPPRVGEVAELTIRTRNVGMGHAFPESSLDLEEAWLEVRVTDANGELVFSSGGVDAEQRILPGSHTLGGRLLDADGRPIEHYRVWAGVTELVDRQIPAGGSVEDRFEFRVPEGTRGHLNVDARWHYRKLGQAFWDWAYGSERPIPSPVVLRVFTAFPLVAGTR